MKKPSVNLTDEALIDYFQQLYLADTLEKEMSISWVRAKAIARKILDDLNQSPELFRP